MEIQKDLIFDAGMHIGQDTEFFSNRAIGCGHRGEPCACGGGKTEVCTEIAAGQLDILNVGIFETEGVADFWICDSVPKWEFL